MEFPLYWNPNTTLSVQLSLQQGLISFKIHQARPAPTKRPELIALLRLGGVRSKFRQGVVFSPKNVKYRKVID